METYCAHEARSQISGLACLTAVLLAVAMISQSNLAAAADGKDGGAITFSVIRGAGSDRSDGSEVPAGGSVVLRGTRPPKADASETSSIMGGEGFAGANNAFQQGPTNPYQQRQNNTFHPGPLYGSGWDTQYDYSGLSGVYYPKLPQ